ncbi:MAG TPA: ABC transporter substrate-binding protein [Candidatus Dormibacteraeota bacterium]
MDEQELRRDAEVVRQLERLVSGRITRREALRRLGILGISLPAASSLIAACTSSSTPQVSTKTKAIIGIVQEPTALDPTAAATASIYVLLRDNVYEGLVRLDQNGKIVPQLAKSWDVSSDGTTFTFHLQPGVTFHDGSSFTAQDVKFSWDRAKDPTTKPVNPHADYFQPVTSVTVVDDHTVKVVLSQYSDNWLFHMTAGAAIIVSPKTAATNATVPVGTGPFKFVTHNPQSNLTLTRNDSYWGSKAKLKDVEFRFITDANAMNNAMQAGDIDAIGQVGGPEQVQSFKSNQNFKVITGPPAGKTMVSINNTSGPLADARVRQAIYAAIDRKAWIDGIVSGYAVPIGSHAVPNAGEPYYVDETGVNKFDVQKAKQLLADAGQTNLTVRLAQITDFPYAVRGTDVLNSELKAIGVTLKVIPMQFSGWLAQVFLGSQDYDLTIINHTEERDIGNYALPKYYWHVNNPALASQLKQADAETDAGKRKNLYTAIQKTLADNAYNAWVFAGNVLGVTKHNLQGYSLQGVAPSLYVGDLYFS